MRRRIYDEALLDSLRVIFNNVFLHKFKTITQHTQKSKRHGREHIIIVMLS